MAKKNYMSENSLAHFWQVLKDTFAKKTDLSKVATSGSYNDLSNKPTIPTVNNATLTIQKNGTQVQTFTANQSSNVTANITVPTKVSELSNDSNFITASSNITGNAATATKATQDGSGNTITSTYVKKAGDTMTGNLTISKTNPTLAIRSTDHTTPAVLNMGHDWYNRNVLTAYPATDYGYNLVIEGGSVTAIGSGESASGLLSAIGTSKDAEVLYLLSDNQIHIASNAQGIGNRVGYQIDNSANIIPEKADVSTNNFGSVGTASYNFANVYSTNYKFGNNAATITYNSIDKCIEFNFG